jgi:hypothetical protein
MTYNRNRYYSTSSGRFISQDPISFNAGDANLYRYVGNSPTNATDPSGLETWREKLLGKSIYLGDPYMQQYGAIHAPAIVPSPVAGGQNSEIDPKELEALQRKLEATLVLVASALAESQGGPRRPRINPYGPKYPRSQITPFTPKPLPPKPIASEPVTPNPVTSKPVSPKPQASEPVTPSSAPAPDKLPVKQQQPGVPVYGKNPFSAPATSTIPPGRYVYVQDADGVVHLVPDGSHLHPTVLGGGRSAAAAGEITIGPNGVVTEINNISYTFQHGPHTLPGVKSALEKAGLKCDPNSIVPYEF